MSEKLPSKRIGDIGQKSFELWANQADIIANPSTVDERGWDALLQLPSAPEDQTMGLWDRAAPEISCMVQVKTTTSNEQSEEITLSNWQRMVRDPQPWFVMAIHLNADNEPSQAYLVHIDREWCKKVLIRLRELARQGKKHLNEHTLNVTWTDFDKLPSLHGRELVRRIRECVKPDQLSYIMEKINWYENVGYRDKRKIVSVQFKTKDRDSFMDKMSDVGIGLRSTLPAEWRASVSDVRFGIKAAFSEFGVESGEMEFRPEPLMSVPFEVFSGDTGRRVSVDCQFYRSVSVFPFLPPEFDKSRLVYKYFECVLGRLEQGKYGAVFVVNLPPDSPMTVHDMRTAANLVMLLKDNHKHPIGIGIAGKRVENLLLSNPNEPIGQIESFELLDSGARLCDAFGVPDTAMVVLGSLYEQRDEINFMLAGLKAEIEPGNLMGPCKHMMELGTLYAVITACFIQLEDFSLLAVAGFYGPVTNSEESEGMGCRITVEKSTAISERLIVRNEELSDYQLGPIKEKLVKRLQELGCEAIHIYEPSQGAEEAKT